MRLCFCFYLTEEKHSVLAFWFTLKNYLSVMSKKFEATSLQFEKFKITYLSSWILKPIFYESSGKTWETGSKKTYSKLTIKLPDECSVGTHLKPSQMSKMGLERGSRCLTGFWISLSKCGKMRTRIIPNEDTFYAVSVLG